ncbi:hypothetical protein BT69DRAFT_1281256 [Atractiella rhizophila]|nr:hypothetical protein BT69DRAFT_1281256 [Atractiella rhizophila]
MTLPIPWPVPEMLRVHPPPRPTSLATESDNATSSRQSTAQGDFRWLEFHYGGKMCVFTQLSSGAEWCRVLEVRNDFLQDALKMLNLLPIDFRSEGYQNLFPSVFNQPFDIGTLGFLPNIDVLKYFVLVEEGHLRYREDCLSKGQGDPGRFSYSEFYGQFDASGVEFDAYFIRSKADLKRIYRSLDNELCYTDAKAPITSCHPFPRIKLFLSLTITIWVEVDRLNTMHKSATADPYVNLQLAQYLKALWTASPSDRTELDSWRPHFLPVPGLWPYAEESPGFTLFSTTMPTGTDLPGLSFTSQSCALTWSLPEFDYQEKPQPEAKPKNLKFSGMTTEEAMSQALASRGLTIVAEH